MDTNGNEKLFIGDNTQDGWISKDFVIYKSLNINKDEGYTVEIFIPYSSITATERIEYFSLMSAFNNLDILTNTSVWYSMKGMYSNLPSSYALVNSSGVVYIGENDATDFEITADWSDSKYEGSTLSLMEVNENNDNPQPRAEIKAKHGGGGLYFIIKAYDKQKTCENPFIYQNDYLEIIIDTTHEADENLYKSGVFRFRIDVLGGIEVGIGVNGFNSFMIERRAVFSKVIVNDYIEGNAYDYLYTYVYEVMIPWSTIDMENKVPMELKFGWAIHSPFEESHVLDNFNEEGVLLKESYLWANNHNPNNPKEYYIVNYQGIEMYEFPTWTAWEDCIIQAKSNERYNYRGFNLNDGLYLNVVQYVDKYVRVGELWSEQTHVELEIGNPLFGEETVYVALFPDDIYKINNTEQFENIQYHVTVTKENSGKARFSYKVFYELHLGFENDSSNAFVRFLSYTPLESIEGYENSVQIIKDDNRIFWTDDCLSYKINQNGIYETEILEEISNIPNIYAVFGGIVIDQNAIFALYDETTAIFEELALDEGYYEINISSFSKGCVGVIFGYSWEGDSVAYYAFYIKSETLNNDLIWRVELAENCNGFSTVLMSEQLSQDYDPFDTYSIKIEIQEGKYSCYFDDKLYFSAEMFLNGTQIGIYSEYSGSRFSDVSIV